MSRFRLFDLNPEQLEAVYHETGPMLILAGEALKSWLGLKLNSALHAVRVEDDRAVFARMYLPPKNSAHAGIFFSDFFTHGKPPTAAWRRLQDEQCGAGEIFCWHDCVPGGGCGEEAKCWDYAKDEKCLPDTHNDRCAPKCFAAPPAEKPLCIPGSLTSMYMDGFHSSLLGGTLPCVVLFTAGAVLDERWKIFVACLMVFLLGGSIEGVVVLRKKVGGVIGLGVGKRRVVLGGLFFVNMTLAYLAMLVAMIYSIELFISVVLGLVAGHLFWSNGSLSESIEPCCVTASSSITHNCQCT